MPRKSALDSVRRLYKKVMFSHAIALLLAYTPVSQQADQSFAAMPTGTYRYLLDDGDRSSQTFLFRKSGSVVIGAELMSDRSRASAPVLNCFRGQAEGDRIIHITRVSPPYSPLSNWESGQSIEIANQTSPASVASLEEIYLPTDAEQISLETCTQLFWR